MSTQAAKSPLSPTIDRVRMRRPFVPYELTQQRGLALWPCPVPVYRSSSS